MRVAGRHVSARFYVAFASSRDTLCICFLCIYQMLFALVGWLPAYQFTFGSLQALSSFPLSDSSGPSSQTPSNTRTPATASDLFNDPCTTDAWVYYVCNTAAAVVLLALTESSRARALLSPIFRRVVQAFMCCATPESLQSPPAPADIHDDDVRACAYS